MTKINRFLKPFHFIFEVRFKFVVFILLFVYLIGIFAIALSSFRSDDPIPDVKMVSLKMRKQFRDLSSKIRVGLYIRNFTTFNFTANNFVVDGMVWFEFDKHEAPLKAIDQFSFENSKMIFKSPPYVSMYHDKILVKYDVIFDLKTDVSFHRYPLEDHRLSIVLTNHFISPEEVYFDDFSSAMSFIVSDNLFTSDWRIYSQQSISGYSSLHFDQYDAAKKMRSPQTVFTINFQKAGVNNILLIFIPLLAAVFLALFSFLMSFNNYSGKPTLGITAVTALLGYRFVIQQMSPTVGYFTLTDKVFLFCLLFSFFIFIFQALLVRHYMILMEREKIKKAEQPEVDTSFWSPRITERINSLTYYAAVITFAVVMGYLILG